MSKQREQFGRPICEFQGLQWMLVDMNIQLEAARALVHLAARGAGSGFPDVSPGSARQDPRLRGSYQGNQRTRCRCSARLGIRENLPLERMVRDARMFTIGGGTAQILRTVLAAKLLDRKLPQTRDGYLNAPHGSSDGAAKHA